MLQRMYAIEQEKILRQRMTWVLVGAAGVIAAGVVGLMLLVSGLETQAGSAGAEAVTGQALQMATWPGALVNTLDIGSAAGIGSLLVIILAGAAVTQEYQWRTLHLWLGRGVPRPVYASARFASLLLPVLLMVSAALLAGSLASLLVTLVTQGTDGLEGLPLGVLLLGALRAAYTLLPYAALAYLLGIATRSGVAAIGAGLAFSLLFENLAGQMLVFLGGGTAQVVRFLPVSMANSVVSLNHAALSTAAQLPAMPMFNPGAAALGIAIYTLALLGLAAWMLQRQDLAA
jgi:ABC-type transport system involved in multi-copper enzyme maturation permease subunit